MAKAYLLHQLLSESARRAPASPAVWTAEEELTYGELEARSNRLARALVDEGVRPGDRVGLWVGKSVDAVVSIFAVLKAGACYVPLDRRSPLSRVAGILGQCKVRCLVASSTVLDKLGPELPECPDLETVVVIDGGPSPLPPLPGRGVRARQAEEGRSAEPPGVPGTDQDLAYVLFTSGSTGTPKGVMLSHLNALTFVNWAVDTYGLSSSDRLSNHAPWTFDLSVFDLFGAVKAGACVNLVSEAAALFPMRLADFIEERAITVWYSVPSALMQLLERGGLRDRKLPELRLVFFAGEVFPTRYLRELMEALPGPRYVNLYGPTETNVITYYEVEPIASDATATIPIGRTCANTRTVVLDADGRPVVEPGREGLLYAAGSTVMQGYYGRPADSDAMFVDDPIAEGRRQRLYCTGDWVVLDEKGDYLFLGRRDDMVKTRGYRVELGEIERALYADPAVLEAAALAVPDERIGNRIKAVVVAAPGTSLDPQTVRGSCASRLPKYMVPELVEVRDRLPRTATGKVDRARLRAESVEGSDSAEKA